MPGTKSQNHKSSPVACHLAHGGDQEGHPSENQQDVDEERRPAAADLDDAFFFEYSRQAPGSSSSDVYQCDITSISYSGRR